MGIASLHTEHLNIESGFFNVLETIIFIYLFKGYFWLNHCASVNIWRIYFFGGKKKKKAFTPVNYFSTFFFPLKPWFCSGKESYFYVQKSAISLLTIRDASSDLSWLESQMKVSKTCAMKCSARKQLSKFHLMMENNLSCQTFPCMFNRIFSFKSLFLTEKQNSCTLNARCFHVLLFGRLISKLFCSKCNHLLCFSVYQM